MVRRWAQETKNPDGQRVIDSEWVQIALGRAHARIEALALINWKLAADADAGVDLSPAEASATKIYGSELATEVYRSLMEIVGPNAGITGASDGAVLAGRLERFYRSRPGDDVRRRHQRDPARHHRVRRPRPPRSEEELNDMDFTFTQEQDEAAELAAKILEDRATNERMKTVEAAGNRFDRDLWAELGAAGLLGLALPEEYDGAGLGLIELCRVLVEVGRTVAPVPLAAHGPASRLIAELGIGRAEAAVAARRRVRRARAHRRGGRGARLLPRAADDRRDAGRRVVPAHRQQGDRAGRSVRRRCSWCPPRRRPASASSSSSPATRA